MSWYDRIEGGQSLKIALLCPDAFTAWHFYKGILEALIRRRCDVFVISEPGEYVQKLRSLGVTHIPLRLKRYINPISNLRSLWELYRIFRAHQFNCVHCFFLKLNLLGAVVARLVGVETVLGTVEGLGFSYAEGTGRREKLMEAVRDRLNRLACRLSTKVWFVNGDDLAEYVSRGIIPEHKAVLIKSHGVNLDEYSAAAVDPVRVEAIRQEIGIDGQTRIVTMVVARMVWSKGVKEFLEASKLVGSKYPSAKFVLVGAIERGSPQIVPAEYVNRYVGENFYWCSTFRTDVREIISVSDLVVLPSYYREGVPAVLLEAMAMGKPIVTTDNVGCREVVEDGRNGFLIPVKDFKALAAAIEKLLMDQDMRRHFGQYSRAKAKREFDEREVVNRVLNEVYGMEPARADNV